MIFNKLFSLKTIKQAASRCIHFFALDKQHALDFSPSPLSRLFPRKGARKFFYPRAFEDCDRFQKRGTQAQLASLRSRKNNKF
jgi:hypothetical protein